MVSKQVAAGGGKLRREISLPALVAGMIGLNIGGSLFVLTAMAAGLTGPSIIIAQLISATPVLLGLVPYLMLTSAMPTNCGNYQYAKFFSRPLAVAGWWGLFAAIPLGALPLFAIATAKFIVMLVPGLPVIGTAIAVMTVFYVLNILGIKAAAQVQFGAVALLVGALLTFIIGGIPAIQPANLTPMFTGGAIGLIGASALMYTLLAGGLFGIEMGGEVKNAERTIPRALVISSLTALLLYLLIELVAVGVVDWRVFAEGGSLGIPAETFLSNPWLGLFIIGGGILASTTTINLTLTASGRYVMASSQDRLFPGFFASVNKKFGTPHWGLTLAYFLSLVAILAIPSLETLAAMLNFGLLFMITLVLLAAWRIPKTHPEIYANSRIKLSRRAITVTSLLAASMNIIFMLILATAVIQAFLIFVAFMVVGITVYFVRKMQLGRAPSLVSCKDQASLEPN
ncbi:MAG: APC family permease [Dehalococcoidales bacterium]|jgi:APA family basic amino acid/polyamine antiporter|nr:APC family permease [Dehalococcoidales bacterium]